MSKSVVIAIIAAIALGLLAGAVLFRGAGATDEQLAAEACLIKSNTFACEQVKVLKSLYEKDQDIARKQVELDKLQKERDDLQEQADKLEAKWKALDKQSAKPLTETPPATVGP